MGGAEQLLNARRAFKDALNLFVGPRKRFEVKDVAASIITSPDTIGRALRGESCPDWCNALALMSVLPIEFAEMVLRPAGLTGVRRIDDASTTPAQTLSETAEAVSALASALADGRIDHTERPRVLKEVTEAICALSQLAAQLGGAK